jgi:hypothetical protein
MSKYENVPSAGSRQLFAARCIKMQYFHCLRLSVAGDTHVVASETASALVCFGR